VTVRDDTPRAVRAPEEAQNLGTLFLEATACHHGPALRLAGSADSVSYPELGLALREIAGGLMTLGIEPGDRVSIIGDTRPEWTLADLGALCAGAVVVPIYQTNAPEECEYVLTHAGSRVILCEDAAQVAKVDAVRANCPALEHVVVLCGEAPGALTLRELRERGAALAPELVEARAALAGPDDLATLVYTSGTTGPPKGCMLTHRNMLATMRMSEQRLALRDDTPSIFLFLPLAHVLARLTQLVAIDVGGTLVYWNRDSRRLREDLAAGRPSHLPAVPRVYEKIRRAVLDQIEGEPALKQQIFRRALAQGRAMRAIQRAGARPGPIRRARYALADRLVLRSVRDIFGGNLREALVGAAPIGAEILDFFDACGVEILEGYGLTESCAAATLNVPGAPVPGTAGPALAGAQVAIAPDGEILVSGPHVFAGYYRDAAATAEALRDGWLHTGDLGELDAAGGLRLTGRKKDIIITSSGKNITPVNLESALRETRWVSHAVVHGDRRPYLVAMLTLDPDETSALAQRTGAPADPGLQAHDPRVLELLQVDIDSVNARVARIEQIKHFTVLERDLTLADGDLTPTLKVRRAVIERRYADRFDALYEVGSGTAR